MIEQVQRNCLSSSSSAVCLTVQHSYTNYTKKKKTEEKNRNQEIPEQAMSVNMWCVKTVWAVHK